MSKAIPVTDPTRPCWNFFQTILKREIAVPSDFQEARLKLRSLLMEAYELRPYSLLRASLLSDKSPLKNLIATFVASYRANGNVDMTSRSTTPTGRESSTDVPPEWKAAIDYILSQWWVMGDGDRGQTRSEKYKEFNTNTNEIIRSWLPEGLGIIPYLRERTRHVLYDYYEKDKIRSRMVSLDQCAQFRLELNAEGKFMRPMESEIDLDAGQAPEVVEDQVAAEDIDMDALIAGADLDAPKNDPGPMDKSDPSPIADRIALLRGNHQDRPDTYGDWPLRMFAGSDYNPAWGAKHPDYTRRYARSLLNELARIDKDVKADLPTLLEILEEWDGSTPLVDTLPELDEAASRNSERLIRGEPEVNGLEMFAGEELARRTEKLGVEPNHFESKALAIDHVNLEELLSSRDDDYDLNSPDRIDYLFLAGHAGEMVDTSLSGERLHASLRRLAESYTKSFSHAAKHGAEMYTMVLKKWDPKTTLFSTPVFQMGELLLSKQSEVPAPKRVTREAVKLVQEGFGF